MKIPSIGIRQHQMLTVDHWNAKIEMKTSNRYTTTNN